MIADLFSNIAFIETPDAFSVTFHMSRVDVSFLNSVSQTAIVPASYHEAVGEEAFKQAPVGTGAFQFVAWRVNERLSLRAFD